MRGRTRRSGCTGGHAIVSALALRGGGIRIRRPSAAPAGASRAHAVAASIAEAVTCASRSSCASSMQYGGIQ